MLSLFLEKQSETNHAANRQRKTLSHANLVSEVISQLANRFKPDVSMVKVRIEDLLFREYLERDEDGTSYRYLA